MRASARFAIVGATVASAMSLGSLLTPAPSSADTPGRDGLQPLTNVLRAVDPHDPEWVDVRWTTDRPVCDVRVRVHGGRNVDVEYPGDRRYTSFAPGEDLQPGRIDGTPLRVTANGDGPHWVFLTATVDYDYCRGDSPTMNDAIGFWLPVRA